MLVSPTFPRVGGWERKILVVSALLRVLYRIGCFPSFTRSPHVMLLHAPELRCEQRLPTNKVFSHVRSGSHAVN